MYGLGYCKEPLNDLPRAAVVNCPKLNVLKKQNPHIYYLTDLEVRGKKVVSLSSKAGCGQAALVLKVLGESLFLCFFSF